MFFCPPTQPQQPFQAASIGPGFRQGNEQCRLNPEIEVVTPSVLAQAAIQPAIQSSWRVSLERLRCGPLQYERGFDGPGAANPDQWIKREGRVTQ